MSLETNLTMMLGNVSRVWAGETTIEQQFLNGTPIYQYVGDIYTYSQVVGLDLIIQLLIGIMLLLSVCTLSLIVIAWKMLFFRM